MDWKICLEINMNGRFN